MKPSSGVRPSPIAGQWYTADPRRLAGQIDSYLQTARLPVIDGEVIGVMAPHAGHIYSGPVAGYAFAALQGMQPDLVVVVSPMHYTHYFEPLLTTAHVAYATPLGEVPVDETSLKEIDDLLTHKSVKLARVANDPEHSLEIELPFLQRVFQEGFSLLPIMVREHSAAVARNLGETLAEVLKERSAVMVASTDLSHFYTQSTAKLLDEEMLRQVENFDPQGVLETEMQGKGYACGRGALAAVMWAARALGADHARVLRYATSGDVTGDLERVVGYGAAVFTRLKNG